MTKLAERQTVALADYALQINATHRLAKAHAEMAVVLALRVGLLCIQAKDIVGHGGFGDWVRLECPGITERSVRKYMALAKTKSESGSDLPRAELMAGDFAQRVEAEAGYREGLIGRVREVVGPSPLTQLYQEHGVIAIRLPAQGAGRPDSAVRGVYTPHAVRVSFDRCYRQTLERMPLADWTPAMCSVWERELRPIAELYAKVAARAK